MKHNYFLWLIFAFSDFAAQSLEPCKSDHLHQQMLNDDIYSSRMRMFDINSQIVKRNESNDTYNNDTYLVVPIVVHLLHHGDEIGLGMNLSRTDVQRQIDELNKIFRNDADLPDGQNTTIQFALAIRDTNGNCSDGIDRVDMSNYPAYLDFGVNYNETIGLPQLGMKSLFNWDPNQYYNIYVVNTIDNYSSINGFASMAGAHGLYSDGTVITFDRFMSGISTLVHELGHALNLYHTFEGDQNGTICPIDGCGSNLGDCCNDTAPHIRTIGSCITQPAACAPELSSATYAYNYMSYNTFNQNCRDRFSAEQKDRMLLALTTLRASLLESSNNLSLVPVTTESPIFSVSSMACEGQLSAFDESPCIPNIGVTPNLFPSLTYLWTLSDGQNSQTSIDQNPMFDVSPGTYSLTCERTINGILNTSVQENITILSNSSILYCEPTLNNSNYNGFTISNVNFGAINNTSSPIWNDGYSNNSCTDVTSVIPGQTYTLIIDGAPGFTSFGMTFRHYIKAFIDYNGDGIFQENEIIATGRITSQPFTTQVQIPTTAQQGQILRLRIAEKLDTLAAGNTITLNDINCNSESFGGEIEDYGVYINPTLLTSENLLHGIMLWPNPSPDQLNIKSPEKISQLKIFSTIGQLISQKYYDTETISLDVSHLSSGIYFLEISIHQTREKVVLKFLKS